MTNGIIKTTAFSLALLLAGVSAQAAGLTIGNTDAGTSATVSDVAGNGATVNVGNNSNAPLATIDSAGNPAGNGSQTTGNVNLLGTGGDGPLAAVDNNGNLTGDDSSTTGQVNLGSLLDGIDLGGIGGGLPGDGTGSGGGNGTGVGAGAGSANGLQRIAASLSAGDRAAIQFRCRNVIADPSIYKADVVNFCRMIARL